jgi:PST family polysaccharide transporter
MLLVHSIAMPLALLLVRDTMMSRFGAGDAGLWQSAVRLSDMYTMVVITTLSMYSLPTLSAARGAQEFRALLLRLVGACLGLALVAGAVLFAARELIVHIVFTPQFAPVAQLWPWQLLGDVFLLAGWPMRSALTAQRRTWAYMAVEAGIGLGLVGVTTLLAARMGPVAGNMAHAAVWSTVFVVLALLHLPTWRCRVRVKETR